MVELELAPESELSQCDQDEVQRLARAGLDAMHRATIDDITTPSELLSASFAILDHMLEGLHATCPPEDRSTNIIEIRRALDDMILEHASIRH